LLNALMDVASPRRCRSWTGSKAVKRKVSTGRAGSSGRRPAARRAILNAQSQARKKAGVIPFRHSTNNMQH
jgi:hypothetical protein